jgi:hypothetical protein
MASHDIQSFTYESRHRLLPELTASIGDCGGWILERKTLSASNVEFRVEIQVRSILDLYAAVIASGLELTRPGHEAFTDLCSRRNHVCLSSQIGQILLLRLEISFLEDITLHSLLSKGSHIA